MTQPKKAEAPKQGHTSIWPLQYLLFGMIAGQISHLYTPVLLSAMTSNKDLVPAASYLGAIGLSYLATGAITNEKSTKPMRFMGHAGARLAMATAFAVATGYLIDHGKETEAAYKAERAARIFIDPKTVIGTKDVTIADQQCQYKAGQEVTFKRDGKTYYTSCPR